MNFSEAEKQLNEVFSQEFNEERFTNFVNELFIDFNYHKDIKNIPLEFTEYVDSFVTLGGFTTDDKKLIKVYVVKLKKSSSRDRARTMQRNLIANEISKVNRETGALIAFYDDNPDWRLSFVRLSYTLSRENGELKSKQQLSSPKRFSFLVGPNEPNHTCKKQFIDIFMNNTKKPTLVDFENIFSIENVSDDFFKEYKKLFLDLADSLRKVKENDSVVKEEFNSKNIKSSDFAKKLMGQLVFIYFLQKKGWLGVEKDSKWGSGPKNFLRLIFNNCVQEGNNFFNDVLEPLFYEGLSEDVHDDHYSKFGFRIPFLNGGLFEPINNYRWMETDITLENEIFSNILDTFDKFNFTIKEDEPLEKEVAVDPEMLGKVFENLLEVKEQKDKGAFYTPRYIVHYICKESLINYLSINSEVSEEDLRIFIIHGDRYIDSIIRGHEQMKKYNGKSFSPINLPNSIKENANILEELLCNVKIIDPAVGSGAFPVAMMNEIVNARHILLLLNGIEDINFYELKKEIIENSLYGVDIELSATDITKLRFCLSLIVDEEATDFINPLPNLDYKIMWGNSLVDCFEDIGSFNGDLLVKSSKKSSSFINVERYFEELESKKREYFTTFGFNRKNKLKNEINELKWKFIRNHLNGKEEMISTKLLSCENLEDNLFIWELEYSEVFKSEKPGFDIVIGNPPYNAKLTKEEYINGNRIPKKSESYFIKLSYMRLLKNNGVLGFIIPKPFSYTSSYVLIRDYVLDNIKTIIDCGKVWKNVKLEEIILIINKSQKFDYYTNGTRIDEILPIDFKVNKDSYDEFNLLLNGVGDDSINLAKKIKKSNQFLGDISETVSGSNLQTHDSSNGTFEFIGGAEIQREGIVGVKGKVEKKNIKNNDYIKDNSILIQDVIGHSQNPNPHIKLVACIPNRKDLVICNTINQIIINKKYNIYFFWSLINSKLINWYCYKFIYSNAIRTMHFNNPVIKRLPLPSFDNNKDLIKSIIDKSKELYRNYQRVIGLKEDIFTCLKENSIKEFKITKSIRNFENLDYNAFLKKINKKVHVENINNFEELFNRTKESCLKINEENSSLESEINALIYKVYGLNREEIKLIESNF